MNDLKLAFLQLLKNPGGGADGSGPAGQLAARPASGESRADGGVAI